MRTLVLTLVVAMLVIPTAVAEDVPVAREGATHAVPLYGELLRPWDAPHDDPFAPGHRGMDVAAPRSTPVRASADGSVSFAGIVAGNRSVTIDHGGGLVTSYSFLETAEVAEGDEVAGGDIVGTVGDGHPSGRMPPHVHLSARQDGVYIDPADLYLGSTYSDVVSLVG